MIKSNYHIHSTYCDGKNTLEEMVLSAVKKGLTSIGFSSHAYQKFDNHCTISFSDIQKYKYEISTLKEKYKDKIEIYTGIERDYFSDDHSDYDFVIGSVHYLKPDIASCVDAGKQVMIDNVNKNYLGNYLSYVKDYYELMHTLPKKTNCDIIGHFDIISIYNDGNAFFDENSKEYQKYALDAAEYIIKNSNCIFEINSGAVYRGYKKSFYPSLLILKAIKKLGGEIILTTDCHNAEAIDFGLSDMSELAKTAGFKYAKEIKNGKFVDTLL